MRELYPIFMDLARRPVLVVGGGRVAARKARALLEAGARVTVVAPQVTEDIVGTAGELTVEMRPFSSEDIEGNWLIIAATDDAILNRRVYREATERGILCNVVDQPDLCSFHVPAVVHRGLLQIAISTGGAGPGFARRMRVRLEKEFGPACGPLVEAMLELRGHLKSKYPDDPKVRRELMESFIEEVAPGARARYEDEDQLAERLEQWKSR